MRHVTLKNDNLQEQQLLWVAKVILCFSVVGCHSVPSEPASSTNHKETVRFQRQNLPNLHLSPMSGETLHQASVSGPERLEEVLLELRGIPHKKGAATLWDPQQWTVAGGPAGVEVVRGTTSGLRSNVHAEVGVADEARQDELWQFARKMLAVTPGLSAQGFFVTARFLREYLHVRQKSSSGYATSRIPAQQVVGFSAMAGLWAQPKMNPDVQGTRVAGMGGYSLGGMINPSWGEQALLRNRGALAGQLSRQPTQEVKRVGTALLVKPPVGGDLELTFGQVEVVTHSFGHLEKGLAKGQEDTATLSLFSYQEFKGVPHFDADRTRRIIEKACSSESRNDLLIDRLCGDLIISYERLGRPALAELEFMNLATPFVVQGTSMVLVSSETLPLPVGHK
jgi:hypothetical protein